MTDVTYLDYAASAPLDPRVRSVMIAADALVGNPSSVHRPGRAARAAIDRARSQVAALIGVPAGEVVFTSGATEANGMAVRGVLRAALSTRNRAHPVRPPHVVATAFEHASLSGSIEAAIADGEAMATLVPPGRAGSVSAEDVAAAITEDTVLVCAMWVNNVLGTIQPVEAIGRAVAAERARRGPKGIPIVFLCDVVQAMPALPVAAVADIITFSSHKTYGPKGVGAMRIAQGTPFMPVYGGGGQEAGRRHGTENVVGIVGFGEAAAILLAERAGEAARLTGLRHLFLGALASAVPRAEAVGASGVPGIVFLRVPGERGDDLALALDAAGFAVSAGSACDAGARRSSRALAAVLDAQAAFRGGVRVSFGRGTGEEDLLRFAAAFGKIVKTPR